MTAIEREALARTWIQLQKAQRDSDAHRKNFWAHEKMAELLRSDPNECWLTILEVLSQDTSSWIIENLAAGPLEDLLVAHGRQFIEPIESMAKDPVFRSLTQLVWKNKMLDDVWSRLQAVARA